MLFFQAVGRTIRENYKNAKKGESGDDESERYTGSVSLRLYGIRRKLKVSTMRWWTWSNQQGPKWLNHTLPTLPSRIRSLANNLCSGDQI